MNKLVILLLLVIPQLLPAADLPAGHPSVKDALAAVGADPDKASQPLPNSGVVLSTIQTTHYTYIEVRNDQEGVFWLAAPKVELNANAKIRFGRGISMVDFYSNSLQREFPEIFFVERVETAEE